MQRTGAEAGTVAEVVPDEAPSLDASVAAGVPDPPPARASARHSASRTGRGRVVAFVRSLWPPTRGAWLDLALAAALTVLVFPVFLVDIGWGLDQSWAAGLHLAAHRDLVFGRDIVFPYGPLGFLCLPYLHFPLQGTVALLLRVPLLFAVAGFVLARLRLLFHRPLAFVLAVPLVWATGSVLLGGGETVIVPVLLLAAGWMVHLGRAHSFAPPWVAPGTGVLSAVLLLCKFDMGVLALGLGGLGALADHVVHRPDVRATAARLGSLVAAFGLTVPLLWVALGQPAGALVDYVQNSLSLLAGFNDAMAASFGPKWELPMAAVSALGVVFLAAERVRDRPRRVQIALFGFLAAVLLAFVKQGFVRQDSHTLRYHAVVVLAALALGLPANRRLTALVVAPAVVASVTVWGSAPFLRPRKSVNMVGRVIELTARSSARTAVIDWGRKAIPIAYPIPSTMIERMRGHRAHIEPVEAVVAWVYADIEWTPLPVFQSYAAFTPALDRLNADKYRSADGPEFVLYERASIDERVARWESPEAMVEFVCRYRAVETSPQWQLFERRADDASGGCGTPRVLDVVQGRRNERIALPALPVDELVVARFGGTGIRPPLRERLQGLLTRPSQLRVLIEGDPVAHRVVRANAAQPHIVGLPACLVGAMGTFDTSAVPALTFTTGAIGPPGPGVTVTLEAIPYRCP